MALNSFNYSYVALCLIEVCQDKSRIRSFKLIIFWIVKMNLLNFKQNRNGYYGDYGGAFVPEILYSTLQDLSKAVREAKSDPAFWKEYESLMSTYSCRPTPITYLENLTNYLGGAKIFVKREDLNHTGAHKANNVMGQGLLTKRLGKNRVIAETGAGQHGVATATMAARFGFECVIYMGEEDVNRQRPNVFWMEQLGAKVVPVKDGSRTLKDAINEALRDWVSNPENTHYVLGTVCGPHPFPEMVAWFQSIIGREANEQIQQLTNKLPDRIYACVGGGSNAIGIFQGFLENDVELVGVEAGGKGADSKHHAIRLSSDEGSPGVAQGYKTYFLQNEDGQMLHTHSIAAGLDYIGVSPILSHLHDSERVRFEAATDDEVVAAFKLVMQKEGLIPALESAHAFATAFKEAPKMKQNESILINQSGRGDKDIFTVADALGDEKWKDFIKQKAASYGT